MLVKLGQYQKHCHCLQSNLVDSKDLDVDIIHLPRNMAWTSLGQSDEHFHSSAVVTKVFEAYKCVVLNKRCKNFTINQNDR